MVIDRGAFLSGRYLQVFEEIVATRAGLPRRRPSGPPQGDPGDRRARDLRQRPARVLAGHAGRRRLHQDQHRQDRPGRDAAGDPADAAGGARLPGADRRTRSGSSRPAASGPARTPCATSSRSARRPAPDWLDPAWFRFGASSLLNDLLLQRQKLATGHYSGPDYVTVD